MAFEEIPMGKSGSGEKAPTTYYKLGPLSKRVEGVVGLMVDDYVEGYYLHTFQRDSKYKNPDGSAKKNSNHVLVKEDGTHHVINGATDIDEAFSKVDSGVFTRLTYLGKGSFNYTDDKGNEATGSAHKALLQQDKEKTCSFEGDKFSAKVVVGGKPSTAQESPAKTAEITPDDVPF